MPKSEKPILIEYLFDQLYDPNTDTLSRDIITSQDIGKAKEYCKQKYSLRMNLGGNPYNFMKDIVRGSGALSVWPDRLTKLGWSGEQVTGGSNVFRFVKILPGAANPLATDFNPDAQTPAFKVQSLSLPEASKSLGRQDEPWLLQVAVNLRVIETHFAVATSPQLQPLEVSHLQMDLKLRKVQIDAMYLARCRLRGADESVLITVEAKKAGQRILTEQVKRQVEAAFASTSASTVLPLAIKSVKNRGVYVVEFKLVERATLAKFVEPKFHTDAIYELLPRVPGV